MPDIHVERHGDRWAVKEGPDATPIFESATREEAEAEARRRAGGGRVVVDSAEPRPGLPDDNAIRGDDREPPASGTPAEERSRESQAGL